MSFSIFKPDYKRTWQVIFTKYGKELYNKIYDAVCFDIDIENFTHWNRDYQEQIIYKENNTFDIIRTYKDNLIVKIIQHKELV